jgi:hypothetical protein
VASEFVEKVNLRKKSSKKVSFSGVCGRFLSKNKWHLERKIVFLQPLLQWGLFCF